MLITIYERGWRRSWHRECNTSRIIPEVQRKHEREREVMSKTGWWVAIGGGKLDGDGSWMEKIREKRLKSRCMKEQVLFGGLLIYLPYARKSEFHPVN